MRNNVTDTYSHPKPVPYDTGKVKIGLLYQPKNQYPMSAFEYRLQESLIEREKRSAAAFDMVCWIVATLLLVWLYTVA